MLILILSVLIILAVPLAVLAWGVSMFRSRMRMARAIRQDPNAVASAFTAGLAGKPRRQQ